MEGKHANLWSEVDEESQVYGEFAYREGGSSPDTFSDILSDSTDLESFDSLSLGEQRT